VVLEALVRPMSLTFVKDLVVFYNSVANVTLS
jgi:hypothetical protein